MQDWILLDKKVLEPAVGNNRLMKRKDERTRKGSAPDMRDIEMII